MGSVLVAFGVAAAVATSLFGCSVLVSTDDLTASGTGDGATPPGDGAPGSDGAPSDAGSSETSEGEAGDGSLPRFCAQAPHAFCEDFDDTGFALPGRWELLTKSGGTVSFDGV